MLNLNRRAGARWCAPTLIIFFCLPAARAADYPRGFFIEDLRRKPPAPAFYNLETHRVQAFHFRRDYTDFIDVIWDRDQGRVFFSARQTPKDPYRIYLKKWPDGDERSIYENPLGPFRCLLSPDGRQLVLQVMGPSAWPILAVHDWEGGHTTFLGEGFSPDWSNDGKRLLFLKIYNHSLPTYLMEYGVDTGTTTLLMNAAVAEAVYTDDPGMIVLKTATQSKRCDMFQLWNRIADSFEIYSPADRRPPARRCPSQREMNAFPGHQFLFFKESPDSADLSEQALVIADPSGGRLQTISHEDWDPKATAVESATLALGEDPLYVMNADGTGQRLEVLQARFIRYKP